MLKTPGRGFVGKEGPRAQMDSSLRQARMQVRKIDFSARLPSPALSAGGKKKTHGKLVYMVSPVSMGCFVQVFCYRYAR